MRRTRLRAVSDERRELDYPAFVQSYLAWHRTCEVGPIIKARWAWADCRRRPGGLHHLRKRSATGALTNPANVLACCNPCNDWIENHPEHARDLMLVVREGDPNWDALGARLWRGK